MIRVLLAEDMHVVRSALAALPAAEPDLDVVAQIGDGNQVVEAVGEHRPDVAVLDIGLPGRDGLEVAADLRQFAPGCRVLEPPSCRTHCDPPATVVALAGVAFLGMALTYNLVQLPSMN